MHTLKESLYKGRLLAAILIIVALVFLFVRQETEPTAFMMSIAAILTAYSKIREIRHTRKQPQEPPEDTP